MEVPKVKKTVRHPKGRDGGLSMNVISWNVKGLGSPVKKATIKGVIRSFKADIVLLQETKLSSMSNSTVKDVFEAMPLIEFVGMQWAL